MPRALRAITFLAAAAALTACSVKETSAPALAGPSEMGLSLTIQASPDVLTQDGSSQSQVVVLARDGGGLPVKNITLRVDIAVAGAAADFGTLSNRVITTGSDGRAVLVYTSPPASPIASNGTVVTLAMTPIGTDYASAIARSVSIRLVPTGVIEVPSGAWFAITPTSPKVLENAVLDGSASTTPSGRPIATYDWNFGDGEMKQTTLPFTSHDWATAGNFAVTLTITDDAGGKFTKMIIVTVIPK